MFRVLETQKLVEGVSLSNRTSTVARGLSNLRATAHFATGPHGWLSATVCSIVRSLGSSLDHARSFLHRAERLDVVVDQHPRDREEVHKDHQATHVLRELPVGALQDHDVGDQADCEDDHRLYQMAFIDLLALFFFICFRRSDEISEK